MIARSRPVCLLVMDPLLFPSRPCPYREYWLDSTFNRVILSLLVVCSLILGYTFEFEFGFESK